MKNQMLDLEELIRDSLHSEAEKIEVPPKAEMWEQIVNELNRQKTLRRNKRIQLAAVATLALFCSFLAISPGNEATAFGKRVILIVKSVFGGVENTEMVSRADSNLRANDSPTEQGPVKIYQAPETKVFHNVEEARKAASFAFKVPKYIPEGCSLSKVTIMGSEKESGEVALYYRFKNEEIIIYQIYTPEDFAQSESVKTEDVITEQVSLNGSDGTLRRFADGNNQLTFLSSGILIRIRGIIQAEELLKIGKSM